MNQQESEKLAAITTGAVKTTTENTVRAMMAAVEAAEEKTKEMRAATEEYIANFEKVTASLAENISAHVMFCQSAIDSIQDYHMKILNVEPKASVINGKDHESLIREIEDIHRSVNDRKG